MSDDVIDLDAFRSRRAADAAAIPRTRTRIYTDADGDVCMDHDDVGVIIAYERELACDVGLLLVAEANPDLFDQIVKALERDRRRRTRPRSPR